MRLLLLIGRARPAPIGAYVTRRRGNKASPSPDEVGKKRRPARRGINGSLIIVFLFIDLVELKKLAQALLGGCRMFCAGCAPTPQTALLWAEPSGPYADCAIADTAAAAPPRDESARLPRRRSRRLERPGRDQPDGLRRERAPGGGDQGEPGRRRRHKRGSGQSAGASGSKGSSGRQRLGPARLRKRAQRQLRPDAGGEYEHARDDRSRGGSFIHNLRGRRRRRGPVDEPDSRPCRPDGPNQHLGVSRWAGRHRAYAAARFGAQSSSDDDRFDPGSRSHVRAGPIADLRRNRRCDRISRPRRDAERP